jgi:hypothetical protein
MTHRKPRKRTFCRWHAEMVAGAVAGPRISSTSIMRDQTPILTSIRVRWPPQLGFNLPVAGGRLAAWPLVLPAQILLSAAG